jgi:amino acid transporter
VLSFWRNIKRVLVGRPLETDVLHGERIGRLPALAVFSSDALSSVAYATEQILIVLAPAGAAALMFSTPIAIAITGLLLLVVLSYRQVIPAYPGGGGSYTVAHSNLGTWPGLVAGASLLVDYVLTVAVSVAAGVAAVTSAVPSLYQHRVLLAGLCIALIALANMRGVRESAAVLAVPTYGFILSMLSLLGVGAYRWYAGTLLHVGASAGAVAAPASALTAFLVLRAFSSGCTAMTGVEAIANGVPAFKDPAPKNAVATLTTLGLTLAVLFLGTTALAHVMGIGHPTPGQTLLSEMGSMVLGHGLLYYVLQTFTAVILLLAANTSFAGFPSLASVLAEDRFLPRQLAHRGDRLVYSNGIAILALLAFALIALFGGDTNALIPLYAIGVFLSFTLSQLGMVRRWLRTRGPRWRTGLAINGVGALATGVVTLIFAASKFTEGAWIVILVIPMLILFFRTVNTHYREFGRAVSMENWQAVWPLRHTVIVPISGIHRGVASALTYALSISDDVRAVYIAEHDHDGDEMLTRWDQWDVGVPLVILKSPYRSVIAPLLQYIDQVDEEAKDEAHGALVTVVLPEIVPKKWWHALLHNNTALLIKGALLFRKGKIVVSVPYHLD